jgi:hypothetical protein
MPEPCPLPPEILAGALQDTVHQELGGARAARTTKVRRPPTLERCPEGHECKERSGWAGPETAFWAAAKCCVEECGYTSPVAYANTREEAKVLAASKHDALMRSAREAARLREGIEALADMMLVRIAESDEPSGADIDEEDYQEAHDALRRLLAGKEDGDEPTS